jgi:acyl-CoA synthetase (AMP-forming)/AMP-acid ligase II/acyl carrier protein
MELETAVLTTLPSPGIVTRPALAEGAPLQVDPAAPNTLTQALRFAAERYPKKGLHLGRHDGQSIVMTYLELLRCASCVQAGLRSHGLQVGSKVVLQLESLEDHFAAFWGCLLGGMIPVTVAIAPSYSERNGVVDKLCNTWQLLDEPPIITTEKLNASVKGVSSIFKSRELTTLCVEHLLRFPPATDAHKTQPDDVAFIQLSSGSTGVPKCIQETHRGIISHIHSSALFNGYCADDISFNWLPMDHVVPILTFHLKDTYLGCQQIHVTTNTILAEPLLWLDLMAKYRVTHTWAPNFGFKLVSDRLSHVSGRQWDLSSIKFFMNAGEQVTMPVVREFLQAMAPFGVRESAMQPAFGMAEVCTCMTYANHFSLKTGSRRYAKSSLNRELEPAGPGDSDTVEFVSLGRVSHGVSIRITDSENDVLPERWIGRFQIKGPMVTPGYYRNDEANRDAFVGEGWFNSGDLGFISDGELFLTGREKEMIIIRGAKFYCYEVEDVVNGIPGVEPTFVATCGTSDPRTGTETLAVFFVPSGVTDEVSIAQLIRKRVTARLGISPRFIVPLPRRSFPKTTSGKIQRTQLKKLLEAGAFEGVLADLDQQIAASSATAGKTTVDQRIIQIWTDVLGRKNLPLRSHLFELGGDSLKAIQIVSRVRECCGTEFPPHLLFGPAGTIEGMAEWIALNRTAAEAPPPIKPVARTGLLPLSYSQLRLWMADQIDPGTSLYNISRAWTLEGRLDFTALQNAVRTVVERHDILRTVYVCDSMPMQRVISDVEVPLPRHDLAHLSAVERTRVVANLLSAEVARPFDLARGPLFRAKLIRTDQDEHLLMLTFHQIVIDAWSLGLFAHELAEFYAHFATGHSDPLPLPAIQYADYAAWQQRWLADDALEKQMAFWKQQLTGSPPLLNLMQPNAPAPVSNESAVEQMVVEGALLQQLRAFNSATNVTSYMSLLTVYKLFLSHWSGVSEVVVGSPESGRRRFETESLLGCFVNMLTLRTRVLPGDSFNSMLQRTRQTTIEAFSNADVPFEKVQTLVHSNGEGRRRLFNVWFGPVDSFQPFAMGDLKVKPRPVFPPVAQFDLSCFLSEQADSITLFFEYKRHIISPERMAAKMEQFRHLLIHMVDEPEMPVTRALEECSSFEPRNSKGQQTSAG